MSFDCLLKLSHRYGSNEEYVLDGGGNTSYKNDEVMYVKGSGSALSTITAKQFVAVNLPLVREIIERVYPSGITTAQREAAIAADMMAARMPGEENKRPSVETVLHAIFPYKLVVHVHPAMVNGLTCSNDGKNACNTLFGELVIWVESALPGPDLARKCISVLSKREKNSGSFPQILLLQNHGVFVAADTAEEIDNLMVFVMDKIRSSVKEFPDFTDTVTAVFPGNADSERQSDKKYDVSAVSSTASELRNLYSSEGKSVCVFCINKEIAKYVSGVEAFGSLSRAFTPDQVVHSHGEYLFVESNASMSAAFFDYVAKTGVKPKIVAVRGIGFFALGNNAKEASRASQSFLDAVKIAIYAKSFGGTNPLPRKLADELVNIYGTSR